MTKIEFVLDKQSDALNWYVSANETNYGVDWSNNMPTPILDKIKNKSKEEAFDALNPMLEKKYESNVLQKVVHDLNTWREKHGQEVFKRMESIVGKPIPVDTIEAKITTTGRCPYNSHKWSFMYYPYYRYKGFCMYSSFKQRSIKNPKESIGTSMHELLHMMLHYYYEDYIKQHGLTDDEFHDMKEAQTIILNDVYSDILTMPDNGYEIHTDIRNKFADFWKTNKNFKEFVDYGIQVMKDKRNGL